MILPKLYRLDSKGKIRQWYVEVIPKDGAFIVTYGVKDGKTQTQTTIVEGKNKGKSNETTISDQAIKEAYALWLKQKDKGYRETIDEEVLSESKQYLPMLAHTFENHLKKIVYPCYIQPKLDGQRCIAIIKDKKVELLSRKGKPINTMGHIVKELETLPDCILDGELYKHNTAFEDLIGSIKRDEANEESTLIEYHVYDCISDEPYSQRLAHISSLLNGFATIKLVETYKAENLHKIQELHAFCVENGYEGAIYRNPKGLYKINGRSTDLLKLKSWKDDEFVIEGGFEDKLGHCVFQCVTKDGKPFNVKMEGTSEFRASLLTDLSDLIGSQLTVKYFDLTNLGVPRFPTGIAIRNYE